MATLLVLSLAVAAMAFVWYRMRKRASATTPPSSDEFEDLNEKFLRNPNGKEGTVAVVRVFQPEDLTLIRSLLDAEGIETYVEESRMGDLYPLGAIPGFADSTVTIYQPDLEAAKVVVEDYLASEPSPAEGGRTRPELL